MFEIKPGGDRGWERGVVETEIGLEESSPFFPVRTMFVAMRRWEGEKLEGGGMGSIGRAIPLGICYGWLEVSRIAQNLKSSLGETCWELPVVSFCLTWARTLEEPAI